MEIITDLLHEENIPYKIRKFVSRDFFVDEEDDEEENICIVEELYEIDCYTDLEYFEFIKSIADKRIKNRIKLEKCYMKKSRKKRTTKI